MTTHVGRTAWVSTAGDFTQAASLSTNMLFLTGVIALARFDRDVLAPSGVTHVVVLEGINDIGIGGLGFPGAPVQSLRTAAELIVGVQGGYYTPQKDGVHNEINRWIRASGEYDAAIDFEAVVGDCNSPLGIKPEYDSGEKLHPGDAGYRQMAGSSILPCSSDDHC